jgi:hypothetical protein
MWHLTLTIALRAVGVRWMRRVDRGVLQLKLGHVGMDHDEFLFVEQYAVRQPQPVDLAFRPARPRTVIADRDRQKLEGL